MSLIFLLDYRSKNLQNTKFYYQITEKLFECKSLKKFQIFYKNETLTMPLLLLCDKNILNPYAVISFINHDTIMKSFFHEKTPPQKSGNCTGNQRFFLNVRNYY